MWRIFRCAFKKYSYREDVSDMRVSKYFVRVCWGRTQTVLIRHPWLSSTFPRHRVGELLCVEQNIKIPGCLNINPCRNIFLPCCRNSRFFLFCFATLSQLKGFIFCFTVLSKFKEFYYIIGLYCTTLKGVHFATMRFWYSQDGFRIILL